MKHVDITVSGDPRWVLNDGEGRRLLGRVINVGDTEDSPVRLIKNWETREGVESESADRLVWDAGARFELCPCYELSVITGEGGQVGTVCVIFGMMTHHRPVDVPALAVLRVADLHVDDVRNLMGSIAYAETVAQNMRAQRAGIVAPR